MDLLIEMIRNNNENLQKIHKEIRQKEEELCLINNQIKDIKLHMRKVSMQKLNQFFRKDKICEYVLLKNILNKYNYYYYDV